MTLVSEIIDAVCPLAVASALGACLGFERELSRRWAGLRTHILVALGSAVFMVCGSRGSSNCKAAEAFLCLAASSLAAQLQLESIAATQAPAKPATKLDRLRTLLHEVNNCLNGMMLQASVLQLKVDAGLHDEVEQIRREGMQAAARMAEIQRLNLW